eukprot:TRINITY_DN4597_c0_g1_i1.p1 TRINITY_DN4597_c0_g1~~TRINITY_DN4597_c0_g1_i1.p1  ORF type:complete len:393 (-),score=97.20 TRINITY_DN4597_c0_g1_i1:6-1184(-)
MKTDNSLISFPRRIVFIEPKDQMSMNVKIQHSFTESTPFKVYPPLGRNFVLSGQLSQPFLLPNQNLEFRVQLNKKFNSSINFIEDVIVLRTPKHTLHIFCQFVRSCPPKTPVRMYTSEDLAPQTSFESITPIIPEFPSPPTESDDYEFENYFETITRIGSDVSIGLKSPSKTSLKPTKRRHCKDLGFAPLSPTKITEVKTSDKKQPLLSHRKSVETIYPDIQTKSTPKSHFAKYDKGQNNVCDNVVLPELNESVSPLKVINSPQINDVLENICNFSFDNEDRDENRFSDDENSDVLVGIASAPPPTVSPLKLENVTRNRAFSNFEHGRVLSQRNFMKQFDLGLKNNQISSKVNRHFSFSYSNNSGLNDLNLLSFSQAQQKLPSLTVLKSLDK